MWIVASGLQYDKGYVLSLSALRLIRAGIAGCVFGRVYHLSM